MVLEDLTKTGKIRRVPVDAGTLALLRSHRAASSQLATGAGLPLAPDAFVFTAEPEADIAAVDLTGKIYDS